MANEKRVRVNNCIGTLGATLASGDTTMQFSLVPSLPTIDSTKHAAIVIEPDTGAEEVVYVTAYTAGQNTATVLRGQEGTTAVSHPASGLWVHGPTKRDSAAGRLAFATRTAGNLVFPSTSYPAVVLADSPVVYLRLEDTSGTAAADSSGNSHPGVYSGTVTLNVTGVQGKAVTFGGGWITVTAPGTLDAPFTYEVWFKSASTAAMKIGGARSPGSTGSWDVALGGTGISADFGTTSAWTATAQSVSVTQPALNTWHHFCMVVASTTQAFLYLDGALVGTLNPAGLTRAYDSNHNLTFGFSGSGGDTVFSGQLDEIAFYPSALSGARVLAHYQAGTGVSAGWADVDTSLDLVVPAFAGDLVEVGLNALLEGATPDIFFDVASVVSAAKVNYWGGGGANTDLGITGWARAESIGNGIPATWYRRLLASDLAGGLLTARLVARGGPRTVDASATRPLQFWARNHGPQEA